MEKKEVIRQITEIGIVPVVRANSANEAVRAIGAVRLGGIK